MNILGIESTCDETGVSLVSQGKTVIFNSLASSADIQSSFGGVVPELAAREQTKAIYFLINDLLKKFDKRDIDAIAVSYGPGLIGSLVVGVEVAKTLSYSWGVPLIGVNHLIGHFFANWIGRENSIKFPAISLIVSGGHTDLLLFKNINEYKLLGSTLDDAAGEAFDKVSKFLNLGYPGGPIIESTAKKFTFAKSRINPLPSPLINSKNYNFSFSGLKTAAVNFCQKNPDKSLEEICYWFQEAALAVLVGKAVKAARVFGAKSIVVGGGVAANDRLKKLLSTKGEGFSVFFPEKKYSVDNGAMISTAAFYHKNIYDPLKLNADSGLHF